MGFSMQELKGLFFLFVSLAFFAMICAAAALSTVMQPVRWSERQRRLS
jgi:hypothetical protein